MVVSASTLKVTICFLLLMALNEIWAPASGSPVASTTTSNSSIPVSSLISSVMMIFPSSIALLIFCLTMLLSCPPIFIMPESIFSTWILLSPSRSTILEASMPIPFKIFAALFTFLLATAVTSMPSRLSIWATMLLPICPTPTIPVFIEPPRDFRSFNLSFIPSMVSFHLVIQDYYQCLSSFSNTNTFFRYIYRLITIQS